MMQSLQQSIAKLAIGCFCLTGCAQLGQEPALPSVAARPTRQPAIAKVQKPATSAVKLASFEPHNEAELSPLDSAPPPLELPAAAPTLAPRSVAQVLQIPAPATEEEPPQKMELNLTSALSLAGAQNPQIAVAASRYREAYQNYQAAQVLWLPSLRAGLSFNHHEGTLQQTDGQVFDVSRSSLVSGLGVQAVGAGTMMIPGISMNFHAADAYFEPKATAHAASARLAGSQVVSNDTLLAASLLYLELLRAAQELRIAEETLKFADDLAKLTSNFASSGQGAQSDAERAQTELVRRRNEVARSQEAVFVASARLAELLHLDPSLPIVPQEPAIVPIDMVSLEIPLSELVVTGLSNRPELAEAKHLVCEAVYRYRRAKYAPLVPSVLLGMSESGFGGGMGSNVDNVQGRFDFDAVAYWELRNLGLGDRAQREARRAQYDAARSLEVQALDRVAREVVEAHAQVQSRKGQIATAQAGIEAAQNAYQHDLSRIREGQGLPIETLQSLQALDLSRREYLRCLHDYNQAQFRLHRALGWQIQ